MTISINETNAPQSAANDEWELVESEEKAQEIKVVKDDENDVVPAEATLIEEPEVSQAPEEKPKESVKDWVRKTSIAVAGGTMVGVGLIMIPLPTPFGAVVAGGGMAVLGTEFPAAQRVLDQTCNKFADVIERSLPKDDDNDTDKEEKETEMFANESMKEIMEDKKRNVKDPTFKSVVKHIGKKAVPAIRRIGHGVDKEQLNRASENVTKAASVTKTVVQTQASKVWRHIMVLDEGESLMTPFA
mmetsp:Transcript_19201/g.31887  ORF Transcript_19201/g.31887 Transcript_19201/m.31887 type:complete len:244 (+) Transcript_19201:124-855(+)|eukprot:CAMPEP_0119013808 /NCGR_PEP_ID=MMETSP1176-20130426/9001_1 /TAXON_ID=265551 /ORGANISM="Synedropsis recta cf, Strain CCMP1620" /LENGTH=243 /DNA_ID=CAMNT_0006966927 /DNA_START=58 /DNA_END=789 /DNA_ORIENTATION=+